LGIGVPSPLPATHSQSASCRLPKQDVTSNSGPIINYIINH
jgi:hypothetical protein